MERVIVYNCFGIGDSLIASSVLPFLKGMDVTLVSEHIGIELQEDRDWLRKIGYRRVGLKPDLSNVKSLIKGESFDWLILTAPSHANEGLKLLDFISVENLCNFQPLEEKRYRCIEHIIQVNMRLVKEKFLKNETCQWTDSALLHGTYELGIDYKYVPIAERTNEVILHVGPKNYYWRHKAFPLVLWKSIIGWLKDNNYKPIIVGDNKQRIAALQLLEPDSVKIGLSMRDLTTIIGRAHCFVGNDCGPAHLAAAVRTPTITFFGPTDPKMTGPYPTCINRNQQVVGSAHCSPCYVQQLFVKCPKAICHDGIGLDHFLEAWNKIQDRVYVNERENYSDSWSNVQRQDH